MKSDTQSGELRRAVITRDGMSLGIGVATQAGAAEYTQCRGGSGFAPKETNLGEPEMEDPPSKVGLTPAVTSMGVIVDNSNCSTRLCS